METGQIRREEDGTSAVSWTTESLRDWIFARPQELDGFRVCAEDDLGAHVQRGTSLLAYLHNAGINQQGWPESSGGSGGSAVDRAVLYDELTRAGLVLPEPVAALEVLGPALVRFAPQLASRHLPRLLSGEEIWCQGFSEPEAGSDLASVRTTATRRGDSWVLQGQKVWTSFGHLAHWCAVLARTGSRESRHRGLTLFWVDLSSPGVTVRPLQALTGDADFSEVFLDDVAVASDHIIGDIGGGWSVAMYLLQYERGMWAWQRQAILHQMLQIRVLGRELSAAQLAELGNAYALLASLRLKCAATIDRLAREEPLGPEVSVDKILLSQTERAVHDLCRSVDQAGFLLSDGADAHHLRSDWFYSRAASVYGGAVEVQKNILATRILGLPREAAS
ncbi:acyl-CoA dehydrogenase family protein [Nocardioides sp. NPDC051685]|uniref:acyl-CoA dehydrogenase family protein n=1 Tax=Nocardioides sp. NPDC051685 TaxID=3364334 RepID=UPI0037BAE982